MQPSAPLDYEAIKRDIEKMDRVKNIHHVHSWMTNEKTIYFETHIDMDDMQLCRLRLINAVIKACLKNK